MFTDIRAIFQLNKRPTGSSAPTNTEPMPMWDLGPSTEGGMGLLEGGEQKDNFELHTRMIATTGTQTSGVPHIVSRENAAEKTGKQNQ